MADDDNKSHDSRGLFWRSALETRLVVFFLALAPFIDSFAAVSLNETTDGGHYSIITTACSSFRASHKGL